MTRPLGAHVSVAGGLDQAFVRGQETGCRTLQIFTKNANRWQGKPISAGEAEAFRRARAASGIGPVLAHDAYLINLASPKKGVREKSQHALRDELLRCAQLGVDALVMHPGAHLGEGVAAGLARIAEALRAILADAPPQVRLLLENTAGQGSSLGADLTDLAELLARCGDPRVAVCFDTCHAHAAGYDLASAEGYARTMAEVERLFGAQQIAAFHLNDCVKPCGSRVDRHAHIGRGTIGRAGFARLMRDPRFLATPMILETPKGDGGDMDLVNLAVLRELAGEGGA